MALSQTMVIAQIRDKVAEVTGLQVVYAASETDGNRLPNSLEDLPCALVLPGPTKEYILMSGQHRHTYSALVKVFEAPGADIGEATNTVLPMVDRIIEKFAVNVGLADADGSNPRANSCIFKGSSGLEGLLYSGLNYVGYTITLEVSEQASASPAIGA